MPVVGTTAYNTARAVTNLVRSLLNDANPLLAANVPIATIQRSANVVQVTTYAPHGLIQNDKAVVSSVTVGATNFNGTFAVSAVGSPTQYSYAQTAANDSQTTGFSGGLGLGATFIDPVLIPYVNAAYRKVQRALANVGSASLVTDDVLLVVAAVSSVDPSVQVSITDATAAPNALPSDLVVPLKIWERPSGSSDDFAEMTDLTQHDGLPSQPQGPTLMYWAWQSDGLYFVGATQATQIRLRYKAAFADLVDGSSPILIRNCQESLAYTAAAMAGAARGAPQAAIWLTAADDAIEDLVNRVAQQMQQQGRRRRPFSSRAGYSPRI